MKLNLQNCCLLTSGILAFGAVTKDRKCLLGKINAALSLVAAASWLWTYFQARKAGL